VQLIVGAGFVEHGWAKLERGVGVFGAILHAIGLPLPDLLAWATVAVELGGGLAVLSGAAVTLASLPFVLLAAIVTMHWPDGLLGYGPGGARFGAPDMSATCFAWLVSPCCCWAERDRSRPTGYWPVEGWHVGGWRAGGWRRGRGARWVPHRSDATRRTLRNRHSGPNARRRPPRQSFERRHS